MFKQISKQLSDITVVDFEDLREFRDFERIPFFDTVEPDIFSLFLIRSREYPDFYSEDEFLLAAIVKTNSIRKNVYDDLQKKATGKKVIGFLKLENDEKIMIHFVGKTEKEPKNNHYEIEFYEWKRLPKLTVSCRYWIKPSNEKRVSDALNIMLPDATIWLDELNKHVSDISRLKLGLILRKLGIATRRVYNTTTRRLRRKIVTPKRMLKRAISKYQIS